MLRLKICDSHLTCKVAHKCLNVREWVEVVEWNKKRSPPFPYCPASCQCPWKKTLIEKKKKKKKRPPSYILKCLKAASRVGLIFVLTLGSTSFVLLIFNGYFTFCLLLRFEQLRSSFSPQRCLYFQGFGGSRWLKDCLVVDQINQVNYVCEDYSIFMIQNRCTWSMILKFSQ